MERYQYIVEEREALDNECKKELNKCETLEEFNSVINKYTERFNKLIAFIILTVKDTKDLKYLLVGTDCYKPVYAERRYHLTLRIKRETETFERLLKVGNDVIAEMQSSPEMIAKLTTH